jgi:hypothetical protein
MEKSEQIHNLSDSDVSKFNFRKKLDAKDTAQYISDMVLELRNMAKAVELKALQDILELSFYEAFSAANRVTIPEGEIEHLRELSKASKVS